MRYSILDLAPVAVGKTPSDAFTHTVDLAQNAERWGYHRYWLAEHHNMDGIASSATAILIGHVSSKTRALRVGSGGIMLPNHPPLIVAEQFGTLESLYPGRIDLGLGRAPGADPLTARALRRELRTQDFAEQVDELRDYFRSPGPGQRIHAHPGSGLKIPIWILGSSLYSARLAGTLGLPYAFASHFAPEHLMEALALYRRHFMPSADYAQPYVMVAIQVVAADTDDRAHHLATTIDQRFLSLMRGESLRLKPPVEDMSALWNPFEKIQVEKKLMTAIRGSPERVRRDLGEFILKTHADEIMVTADLYHHEDRLRSFELVSQALT